MWLLWMERLGKLIGIPLPFLAIQKGYSEFDIVVTFIVSWGYTAYLILSDFIKYKKNKERNEMLMEIMKKETGNRPKTVDDFIAWRRKRGGITKNVLRGLAPANFKTWEDKNGSAQR